MSNYKPDWSRTGDVFVEADGTELRNPVRTNDTRHPWMLTQSHGPEHFDEFGNSCINNPLFNIVRQYDPTANGGDGVEVRDFHDFAFWHSQWSQETFGGDGIRGPAGPLKHLEKEAKEARENPGDVSEFADCLLLTLDAARRAGFDSYALLDAAYAKLEVNKAREWPKVTDVNAAVEHTKQEQEPKRGEVPAWCMAAAKEIEDGEPNLDAAGQGAFSAAIWICSAAKIIAKHAPDHAAKVAELQQKNAELRGQIADLLGTEIADLRKQLAEAKAEIEQVRQANIEYSTKLLLAESQLAAEREKRERLREVLKMVRCNLSEPFIIRNQPILSTIDKALADDAGGENE